ncbi:YggT family protein [Corynebacterium pseudopelargi]|uniref:YGGT family protein n=1 Tax=Corynebacterium pseudopelargi TaxID=2080757 RepID=A0A3G6IY84_9CORY|nr:YggT family protein [Corynebacterium pseudopelargi]AZA08934.1 YGGT family protein [Corynebacterium pseudopelargi]
MSLVFDILILLLTIYTWILIARILIEMIQSFSRRFTAPRWFMVIAEFFFVLTDPPVRLLRRWIPPLRLGQVALDVSILVLFFGIQLLIILLRVLQAQFI